MPIQLDSKLKALAFSPRVRAATLLALSLGLPTGLIGISLPDWMRTSGADIRIVGLATLVHLPFVLKPLFSPFMDRYQIGGFSRWKGWIGGPQVGILLGFLAMATLGDHPNKPWTMIGIALAMAVAITLFDISSGAYTVEILKSEDYAIAGGLKSAFYRAGTGIAGGLAITVAGWIGWQRVNVSLFLFSMVAAFALLYIPKVADPIDSPPSLAEAIGRPLRDLMLRPNFPGLLAFLILFKLGDSLAGVLIRPFLVDLGYTALDRGVALATAALGVGIVGTLAGAILVEKIGLNRSLWISAVLQVISNLGYVAVAHFGLHRPLMYSAVAVENFCAGVGTAALQVLLWQSTEKRYSATQYAILTSLVILPSVLAGPLSGFGVHAWGWEMFFVVTILAGLPGLVALRYAIRRS